MDKSAFFAIPAAARLENPELDYALFGRPTNSFAIDAFDTGVRAKQRNAIQALAKTHGCFLYFVATAPTATSSRRS